MAVEDEEENWGRLAAVAAAPTGDGRLVKFRYVCLLLNENRVERKMKETKINKKLDREKMDMDMDMDMVLLTLLPDHGVFNIPFQVSLIIIIICVLCCCVRCISTDQHGSC